jgi:hypothetical protein
MSNVVVLDRSKHKKRRFINDEFIDDARKRFPLRIHPPLRVHNLSPALYEIFTLIQIQWLCASVRDRALMNEASERMDPIGRSLTRAELNRLPFLVRVLSKIAVAEHGRPRYLQ